MAAQWLLFGAQMGASLWGHREQMRAARRQAEADAEATQAQEAFQREQLRIQGEQDTRDRTRAFRRAVGTQEAAFGAAGVAGGASRNILRRESRIERIRSQARADQQRSFQREASLQREATGLRNIATGLDAQQRQARVDLFSTAVGAGQQGYGIHQQQQAQRSAQGQQARVAHQQARGALSGY